jgi:hypothetical protein
MALLKRIEKKCFKGKEKSRLQYVSYLRSSSSEKNCRKKLSRKVSFVLHLPIDVFAIPSHP